MSETSSSELTAKPSETVEPCPTPLAWQDVVHSFQEQRREGNLEFDGGTVRATQFGEGPPLVFLPGSVGSPRLFALIAWLLREEFQSWILDYPAFRKTPSPANLVAASASAYRSVLQDLLPTPIDLYAPTFSSQVALQMLFDAPEIYGKVVLQSSWAHRSLTLTEKTLLGLGRHLPIRLQRIPLWLASQIANHRPWFPPYDETRFGFLLNEIYQTPTKEVCSRLSAAAKSNLSEQLRQLQTEILLIRTEGDGQTICDQEDILERELPNHRVEWLHTTGHFLYLTHPHRLVKILRGFYSSTDSESHDDE